MAHTLELVNERMIMSTEQTDLAQQEKSISSNTPTWMTLDEMNEKNTTPAMDQYIKTKKENKDYLLFYRMGDFYELFFEDAITVSSALGLTLTHRSKIEERPIPMCGVPYHANELYLARLIKMGYKVAVCEQTESPEEAKKRGYKAVVDRRVVRLITPGTITEDSLLDAKRNNYILSACIRNKEIGIAWIDISTGSFSMQYLKDEDTPLDVMLSNIIARLNPGEILLEDKLLEQPDFYPLMKEHRDKLSILSKSLFNLDSATNTLLKTYQLHTLDTFGDFTKQEIIAAGVLLDYINNTQKGHMPQLQPPTRILSSAIMEIDANTLRSLEVITPNSNGSLCLLKVIDKTITGVGGRLLNTRISAPIMDIAEINNRLDAISFFIDNPNVRRKIRETLRQCMDMERAVQRLSLRHGGPKDLYDLSATLKIIPLLKHIILSFADYQKDTVYSEVPTAIRQAVSNFFDHNALQTEIENTLLDNREDLPTLARNGGFVKEGAYPDLDYLRQIRINSNQKCEELRQYYADLTGVSTLKIKNNSVIGYFIEVPQKMADKLLGNPLFIHRQSVLNAMRFTTTELSAIESEVNSSAEKALEMEQNIFNQLVDLVLAQGNAISRSASVIAELDVAAALAELAVEHNYVRPQIDDSLSFEIIEGRHPVVEYAIKKESQGTFVGNNCIFTPKEDQIWLLTGPNMAGKSTFLRQNALIAILAQAGCFVPAKKAKIGLINKLFSRVGASDDIARGRSTFMVEMVETAAILNRADERSFVILDEIGRGTATFDGLSIAWAVAEHLAEINKCRTIFATHYHELTELQKQLKTMSLHCMKIKEFNGEVIFMHEVIEGSADRSYGIHVAKLAGLPKIAIKRSEQVLQQLEENKKTKALTQIEDLPLFASLQEEPKKEEPNPVLEELKNLDLDSLTPREALEKLYELKHQINNN